VIDAAIDTGVERVILISTDKAVHPVNLYGQPRWWPRSLIVQGNAIPVVEDPPELRPLRQCDRKPGSVIPVFLEQKEKGVITITDPR